jgi:hypothetical protein
MTRLMLCMVVLASLLQLNPRSSSAATVAALTLDTLIQKSEYVVYGRAVGTRSFWDPATSTIWTETELVVLDGAKGRAGKAIVITEPGGVLGDIAHLFPGMPRFVGGEEVVLFLYSAPGNRIRVLGLRQGVYEVLRDRDSGERVVRPAVEHPELIVPDHRIALRSNPGQLRPRRLSEFLDSVRERVSNR